MDVVYLKAPLILLLISPVSADKMVYLITAGDTKLRPNYTVIVVVDK